MSDFAICVVCGKPAGPIGDFAKAKVSHSACAMESCYVSRGEDPGSCNEHYAEQYRQACAKRTEQAGPAERLYSVDDKGGVYQTAMVVAYNEAHAKLLALAEMYGCPLGDVDGMHVKESLDQLEPVELL